MRKVLVIGVGGAGKSTVARELGEITGVPIVHLDEVYWQPGWIEPTRESWRDTVRKLVAREEWIMDGNYGGTLDIRLAAADMVVLLDMPPWLTLPRVVWRWVTHRGQVRPGMAPGCNERLSWKFLLWILRYRRDRRPEILHRLTELPASTRVVVLSSKREVTEFLDAMRERHADTGSAPQQG